MKTKPNFILQLCAVFFLVLAASSMAHAGSLDLVDTAMRTSITTTVTKLQDISLKWLGAFISLQFLITNYKLLLEGAEIEKIVGKLGGSIVWASICIYFVKNGSTLIDKVSQGFLDLAGSISGSGTFSAGAMIDMGVTNSTWLLKAISDQSTGFLDFLPSILGGVVSVMMLLICVFIGFKIFLIKIETSLIIMMAPLSFSFLGLNALKEGHGMAPFRALITLAYRIILLSVVLSAMTTVNTLMTDTIKGIGSTGADIWTPIFTALAANLLLFYLAYKSDGIASNMASGGTNMGTADVASAAAIGGAVAGALTSAGIGSAVGGAASGGIKSMSDYVKSLGSGISNAGAKGNGDIPPGAPASPPPQASLGDQMQAVAASEKEMAASGSADSAAPGGATAAGVDASSGSSGGAAAAPFSKADGATAAASVPASAGQNTRNAAAVGAAMRASGAPETMAALAENIMADGGNAQGVANACGTTPAQNTAIDNALAGASDPAWLNSGSASSPEGSATGANAAKAKEGDGSKAGIGGNQPSGNQGRSSSFMDHLGDLNKHAMQDSGANVHATINMGAD